MSEVEVPLAVFGVLQHFVGADLEEGESLIVGRLSDSVLAGKLSDSVLVITAVGCGSVVARHVLPDVKQLVSVDFQLGEGHYVEVRVGGHYGLLGVVGFFPFSLHSSYRMMWVQFKCFEERNVGC